MASTARWAQRAREIEGFGFDYTEPTTPECYARIRALGLETVVWETLRIAEPSKRDIERAIETARIFLIRNSPILWMYDPSIPRLTKEYLIGVTKIDEIIAWIRRNKSDLPFYTYLLTSQISNPDRGFVGTVFSDGKGKILCETLHKKGVCNHRALSGGSVAHGENIDFFTIENFELAAAKGRFLHYADILDITRHYDLLEGYFEFVRGVQNGKRGTYTTGIGTKEFSQKLFDFPEELHKALTETLTHKCIALAYKEGILK